jgi:hypothetical protein
MVFTTPIFEEPFLIATPTAWQAGVNVDLLCNSMVSFSELPSLIENTEYGAMVVQVKNTGGVCGVDMKIFYFACE